MREMILNHASIFTPSCDRETISAWLKDVALGMSQLVRDHVVERTLRMARSLYDTQCQPGYSLYNAYQLLRQEGCRDEYVFLMRLSTKSPLLSEVHEDLRASFLACQELTLPNSDGEPLVLCAKSDGIAIGFPSSRIWDCDRLPVDFEELLPDATVGRASDETDQLTRYKHAGPICERYRDRLRAGRTPEELWQNRARIFPYLIFGPDVKNNLLRTASQFSTIVAKLAGIDRTAQEWDVSKTTPNWRSKVTDESQSIKQDQRLLEKRKFRSHSGEKELFTWHARYGDNGRIHLRPCPSSFVIEIGYIGPHL